MEKFAKKKEIRGEGSKIQLPQSMLLMRQIDIVIENVSRQLRITLGRDFYRLDDEKAITTIKLKFAMKMIKRSHNFFKVIGKEIKLRCYGSRKY